MGRKLVESGIEPDSPHVYGAILVTESRSVLPMARSRWQAGRGLDALYWMTRVLAALAVARRGV